ncbi:unnamed protein product, partial [Rotaria sordida]
SISTLTIEQSTTHHHQQIRLLTNNLNHIDYENL